MKFKLKEILLAGFLIPILSIALTLAYLASITVDDGLEALIIIYIIPVLVIIRGVFYYRNNKYVKETLVFTFATCIASILFLILFGFITSFFNSTR